jgi:hypothetical protein
MPREGATRGHSWEAKYIISERKHEIKMLRGMGWVHSSSVERPPKKHETLSSNPNTEKKKKEVPEDRMEEITQDAE